MRLNILVQLSENNLRLLIAFLLLLFLGFVIIGYIALLVVKFMKWQGKKIDNEVHDVLITRTVTKAKTFKAYAHKKNWNLFYKESGIALLILIIGGLTLLIRNMICRDFAYNPFNYENGFSSILFLWDWADPDSYVNVFGFTILAKWPPALNGHKPHFSVEAIPSYVFVVCLAVGGIWYFIATQAFFARTIRIYWLARHALDKNLDKFNQNEILQNKLAEAAAFEPAGDDENANKPVEVEPVNK